MRRQLVDDDQIHPFIDEHEINFGKKEIINMLNNNYNFEEIKGIIEAKIDFLMLGKNNEIVKIYDEKINELLEMQEKLYVKNEIIKQKILFLDGYLNSLKNCDMETSK